MYANVIRAPYQVRGEFQHASAYGGGIYEKWIPACAGMTGIHPVMLNSFQHLTDQYKGDPETSSG